jgi:hypothetical protein
MTVGLSDEWEAAARRPLRLALLRLFPGKAEPLVRTATNRVIADTAGAWDCYLAGASAAAFDLLALLSATQMPLPDVFAAELTSFAAVALSGSSERIGRGKRSGLEMHRAALVKRLRYEHIKSVLADAALYHHEDSTGVYSRALSKNAVARIQQERPEASDKIMKAVSLALGRIPLVIKTAGSDRAYYDDYQEVSKAAPWPGRFYLPSEKTCDLLGWADLRLGYAHLGIAADAPHLWVS